MAEISKAYYNTLVNEAKSIGVTEQPYVLASILSKLGGGDGASLTDVLEALETYGGDYRQSGLFSLSSSVTPIYTEDFDVIVVGGTFYNPNNVPVFIKFYEASIPPLLSPNYVLMIPALGQVILDSTTSYFVSNNLYAAAHTTYNGTLAPATNLLVSNIKYKVIET